MRSSRFPLVAAGIVLAGLFAFASGSASACPGQEGECACKKAAAAAAANDAHPAGCTGHDGTPCGCDHDKDGKCECGDDCAQVHGGKCKHAGDKADKKPCACAPGADGKCACGADCAAGHGGECKHAAAAKEGSCGSCGSCAGAAATAPAGEKLKAAIDPATGQLVEPSDDAEDDTAPAAALSAGSAKVAKEVQQPGGGVMVAAPADAAPKAVATIDPKGAAHSSCAE